MKKPLIGVCSRWNPVTGQYTLHPRDCDMVRAAGAIPVMLPFDFEDYEILDGIVFTGGGDVNCDLGGYEDCDLVKYEYPPRDVAEVRHCKAAVEMGIPLLAICRGYQLVNCVLGGTLIRDIAEAGFGEHNATTMPTSSGDMRDAHKLRILPGTLLHRLLGDDPLMLSLHHQAVKVPAPGLLVNAYSPDGVIEGYEDEARHILGVQTHPEMMDCLAPYTWLVEQAKIYQEQRKG